MDAFELLSFPQWQGAGNHPALKSGGELLARTFHASPVAQVASEPVVVEEGIWGRSVLLRQHLETRQHLQDRGVKKCITLGGDCAIEWSLIAHLNEQLSGDLLVVWLDGHADLNTPESSYSHTFHGMVLRTLLGEGDAGFLSVMPCFLTPAQVVLAGVRELDPAETAFIQDRNIPLVSVDTLNQHPDVLLDLVEQSGFGHLYLHVDLDVLDPSQIGSIGWPAEKGLSLDELLQTVTTLKSRFPVAGASITEYLGDSLADLQVVARLLEALQS